MPKATTFGRQSWRSAAMTAVQPKMLRTKRWIAASLTAQVRLCSPASQASPIGVF